MAEKKAKEVNIVDQNAIWRETIRKETRCQKLYTEYHINPYKARGPNFSPFLVNFSNFGNFSSKNLFDFLSENCVRDVFRPLLYMISVKILIIAKETIFEN